MPELTYAKKHPVAFTSVGLIVLFVSLDFGATALFLVGLPTLFVCCGMAAGARKPSRIPIKDALVYVGISVAIVVGAVLYAVYSH